MVPEKGRNAGVALRRELSGQPYDVDWLAEVINERGKRAAKTGVGFESIRDQVEEIRAMGRGGRDGSLRLEMKDFGRLNPRPVFDDLELTDRRIEGHESPADAWTEGATRFYAGYDALLEAALREAGVRPGRSAAAPDGGRGAAGRGDRRTDRPGADTAGDAGTGVGDGPPVDGPADYPQSGAGRSAAGTGPGTATGPDRTAPDRGPDLRAGFEAAVRSVAADRGYELAAAVGDDVKWAVMTGGPAIPERPARVLVPRAFPRLAGELARLYWGSVPPTESFERFAERTDRQGMDEEALLAAAGADVAGIYMFVSGSTADANGLTYEPIGGAVSRLGVFETTDDRRHMTNVTNLKGFYDRYPDEQAAWREVIDVVESTAAEFGFREIDTPAVERTDLYEVKSGEELMDQTYSFEDRGGRRVTLVPEQTPTRARMVQERKDLATPIKWYDTSKRWRYENVQKGRDREFLQTDIDVFGIDSVTADAEVIAVGATVFRRLGVGDRVDFLINDRTLMEALLEAEGIENTTEVMRVIDDEEKMSAREFRRALANRGVEGRAADRVEQLVAVGGPITEAVEDLRAMTPDDDAAEAAVDRMEELAAALDSYGVADMCRLDLSVVRGLAYYTGLVFEAFDSEGELRALFGGGRYDDLVGLFGDREVPAVGFAFGHSPTRELLKREGEWPAETVETDVYVADVSTAVREEALEFASELREAGFVVETDLADRSLGSQLGYADGIDAAVTLIVGERDLSEGAVTVRDMETGDEDQVPVGDLVGEVRCLLDGDGDGG